MNRSAFALLLLTVCSVVTAQSVQPVVQSAVPRIEKMPALPQPWRLRDWKKTALEFDRTAFDYKATGKYFPLIWDDPARRNGFDSPSFGMYTAFGDVREGPAVNNGENHEALGSQGALIGGTLLGVDKRKQHGRNFIRMNRNYMNRENGWNIVMNFTNKGAHIGGGYGNDWWYDVLNNVLFFTIGDLYPGEPGYNELMREIADKFCQSDSVMGNNYSWSFFDFSKMSPGKNHIPTQEDVAAGYAYILYGAWVRFGDEKYLRAAKNALKVLESQKENRSYEILMTFSPYMAARMNAEAGTSYDVQKLMNWSFDGDAVGREGWGVIVGNWGGYDVNGMMGSTVHNGGYGFLMNTFQMAWPLSAMVRYDQRYARAVGKWMLNAANTARFFYPDEMPDSLQALPQARKVNKGIVAYEGLIKESIYDRFKGITPFAQGDGPLWAKGMPEETMLSVYGSSYVGLFGAVISPTNVDRILRVNCTITDFFKKGEAYPTYLYYNPWSESKSVEVQVGRKNTDLYDTVSRRFVARNARGTVRVDLPADKAAVLVHIPSGAKLEMKNGKFIANGVIVDYLK